MMPPTAAPPIVPSTDRCIAFVGSNLFIASPVLVDLPMARPQAARDQHLVFPGAYRFGTVTSITLRKLHARSVPLVSSYAEFMSPSVCWRTLPLPGSPLVSSQNRRCFSALQDGARIVSTYAAQVPAGMPAANIIAAAHGWPRE